MTASQLERFGHDAHSLTIAFISTQTGAAVSQDIGAVAVFEAALDAAKANGGVNGHKLVRHGAPSPIPTCSGSGRAAAWTPCTPSAPCSGNSSRCSTPSWPCTPSASRRARNRPTPKRSTQEPVLEFLAGRGLDGCGADVPGNSGAGSNPTHASVIKSLRSIKAYNANGLLPFTIDYATQFGHPSNPTASTVRTTLPRSCWSRWSAW